MVASPRNMTNYEEARQAFRLEVPADFNYACDVVDAWAWQEPSKPALIALAPDGLTAERLTFSQMSEASNRAANFLREQGVSRGDRVFVMLPRVPDWYHVLLGCFKLGAVPMPGTTLLTARDIAYRLKRAEVTVAVTDGDGAAKVDEAAADSALLRTRISITPAGGWLDLRAAMDAASTDPPDVAPTRSDDPLLIYFTSGTVAYPKMVLHTHAYALAHEITARFWQDLGPDDLHWTVSDMGWAKAAWGKLFGQWKLGAAVLLWNVKGKPDLDRMLRIIGEQGVTGFCAPPTLFRALVLLDLTQYDWSTLRHCTSAGEPLNPEVIKQWRDGTGLTIYDGYGQTETVNIVANYPCLAVRPGSMGKPTPGFDVEVVDEDGNVLPAGKEGHLAVRVAPERPAGLFQEYWRDPEQTEAVFRNGFYYTGDRAAKDEDGYLWFSSRADDVILSAAYRIGPFEVESALIEHPAVAEAAVVGKPDPQRGQIVKAFVVLAPGFEPTGDLAAELQSHAKSVTAPYKYPREIEFLAELPKTISGKIRRVELREREEQRAQAPGA